MMVQVMYVTPAPNGDADPNDLDGDGTVLTPADPSPDGGYACRLFADGRFACG